MVKRIYVEKKPGFDGEAQQLVTELRDTLGILALDGASVINRYDVEGIDDDLFAQCAVGVFSEPQTDDVSYTLDDAIQLHKPQAHCEGDVCTFPVRAPSSP